MSSNHLDIRSVWKSLVASCVCVWLKFEHDLVASDKFICSVISYLKVSRRDYLKTSSMWKLV